MDVTKTSFSNDVFDGFSYERDMLINGFVEKTNNPIVIDGDSHDSWAYTIYEKGAVEGNQQRSF